ncbi:DUF4304 domain-containing protein [Mycobacterium sp. ACS4331]|uniref:DUF4304 domain-containing protein n=1 Tax=Mycobacterium sp. ACS4331 TaxID=1834121 RepID=UPI0009EE8CC8|nr:DUF4304 domain-containing protein [Mycobacterium sp. ACS4331]
MYQGKFLRWKMEELLSHDVRKFLKAEGFSKAGYTFRRSRAPLWDSINFQPSKWNRATPHYGFFVNVGVGSTEIEDAQRELGVFTAPLSIFDRRWENVVPDVPDEVTFDAGTDMPAFATELCDDLRRVLTSVEGFTTTAELVQWAVAHNKLHRMQPVCSYLAANDDIDMLSAYIDSLRTQFGHQDRWEIFNSQLVVAAGRRGANLVRLGILDEPCEHFSWSD